MLKKEGSSFIKLPFSKTFKEFRENKRMKTLRELVKFSIAGFLATIIDWGVFYFLIIELVHYQAALITSYSLSCLTNYVLNKYFTFNCRCKYIFSQVSTYTLLSILGLLGSMGLMYVLIEKLFMDEMVSRILTTGALFLFNYFAHKYITFNKGIFKHHVH